MGFVLLRYLPDSRKYDIHIVFRDNRSGSLKRSVRQGLSITRARGNADWITGLSYDYIHPSGGAGHITTIGSAHLGFAQSMKSILPQVFGCLGKQLPWRRVSNQTIFTSQAIALVAVWPNISSPRRYSAISTVQAEWSNYYIKNGIGFGHEAYARHTDLFNSIVSAP